MLKTVHIVNLVRTVFEVKDTILAAAEVASLWTLVGAALWTLLKGGGEVGAECCLCVLAGAAC